MAPRPSPISQLPALLRIRRRCRPPRSEMWLTHMAGGQLKAPSACQFSRYCPMRTSTITPITITTYRLFPWNHSKLAAKNSSKRSSHKCSSEVRQRPPFIHTGHYPRKASFHLEEMLNFWSLFSLKLSFNKLRWPLGCTVSCPRRNGTR